MRVRMLDSETGTVWPERPAVHLRAGQCYDVPDAVGAKWLSIGLAEAAPVEVEKDDAQEGTTKGAAKRATRTTKGD